MDIDGPGPWRPCEDSSPFLAEDLPEAAAGTTIFAIIGGVIGGGAAGAVLAPAIVAGAAVGGSLYAASCGIKWIMNKI